MLNVSNLSKIQGGDLLFSKGTFQINPGEKVGLVGPNGVGKTTLFRLIIGEERPNEGQVSYSDKLRLSYFSQNVGEMKGKTALQEVIEGDAKISEKHCNFFINNGKAKSSDIEKLINKVKKTVSDKAGVNLELEIKIVGE